MIRSYADENVDGKILREMRAHGIDVITAWDDHFNETDDELVFQRASDSGRVLLSQSGSAPQDAPLTALD